MEKNENTERAFLKLYDELADAVYRHCLYRTSSKQLAEDLTQETYLRLWNYMKEGKPIDNPKAFLYRIASNLIVDYYRKKKESSLDVLHDLGYDPTGEDGSSIVQHAELSLIHRLLQKLDHDHREILVLRYVNGLSIAEVAETIGESENVVSVRIHRATAKLRTLFTHERPT